MGFDVDTYVFQLISGEELKLERMSFSHISRKRSFSSWDANDIGDVFKQFFMKPGYVVLVSFSKFFPFNINNKKNETCIN